ncbi:hypothetical protein RIF29_37800 [Crotalaria pallida]|uniref:Uncharacterized protein n=1 Tax=Crotalaria pallida TaxID=3830 RepID=A0AAN9HNC0_CROPI
MESRLLITRNYNIMNVVTGMSRDPDPLIVLIGESSWHYVTHGSDDSELSVPARRTAWISELLVACGGEHRLWGYGAPARLKLLDMD